MLYNLHLLRALAALGVVYYHITSSAGLNLRLNIGAHGVDVFFVISGFIISYIAAQSPRQFFIRRLIRIVPFYWTATLFVFTVALLFPSLLRSTRADFVQLLCSLLFIPRETTYAGVVPTLVLGWSLNYEMYFYAVFALAMLASPRRAPVLCIAAIILITSIITIVRPASPSLLFYSQPIVFEFGFGIGVYYWFRRLAARRAPSHTNSSWMIWLLAATAAVALGVEEFYDGFGAPRFLMAGIPAAVLVLSLLTLERVYGFTSRNKIVYLLGESSYILYLVHPYIIYGCLRLLLRGHLTLPIAVVIPLIAVLLIISAATAIGIHVAFEKPLLQYLRHRLLPRRMPATASPLRAAQLSTEAATLSGQ